MKCPLCGNRELSVRPSDGYAAADTPIKECLSCRTVWTAKGHSIKIIVLGTNKKSTPLNGVPPGGRKQVVNSENSQYA